MLCNKPQCSFSLLVTVCPCNVRGNCKIATKKLQGMPTIQSAVGILLGTFTVIGKKKRRLLHHHLYINGNPSLMLPVRLFNLFCPPHES